MKVDIQPLFIPLSYQNFTFFILYEPWFAALKGFEFILEVGCQLSEQERTGFFAKYRCFNFLK